MYSNIIITFNTVNLEQSDLNILCYDMILLVSFRNLYPLDKAPSPLKILRLQ